VPPYPKDKESSLSDTDDRVYKWITNSSGSGVVIIGFIDKKRHIRDGKKTPDLEDCEDAVLIIR
jgi:hypothetical protein